MKTIQTRVTVDENGAGVIRLPADTPPGEYDVVVMIEVPTELSESTPERPFPSHQIPWPFDPNETFRREHLYDDDFGRPRVY
jgi:hypothetical protein